MYLHQTSSINSSFKKKRRASFFKRSGVILVLVIIILSFLVWLSRTEKVRVQHITISGDSSISQDDILNVVKADMEKKYLWIIGTDNFILLNKGRVEQDILSNYKKIESAEISFSDMNSIDVKVTNRVASSFWCLGTPMDAKNCFFMDQNGLVFSEAPNIPGSDMFRYFGSITENFVGASYFDRDEFQKMGKFISDMKAISFDPISFNAVDAHEYETYLSSGGKVLLNDQKGFEASFVKLKALVDNGYVKTTPDFLKRINYIDLRFGDKVSFKLR
ncbi:MAG: FtsQ-type POTRA domain-containing protein [Candidatus Paceibacterota bacterium]|jgi:cell division septal protein FtsQ